MPLYNPVTGSTIVDGSVGVVDLSATGTPSSSTYLRGDNTWATIAGGLGLTPTAVKTSAYSAAAADFVPVDTTGGAVTVTFPTAPADGTVIAVKHVIQGGTNTVTVALGGSDKFNTSTGSTTRTLTLSSQALLAQYKSSTAVWYVIADDLPLSGLDARYAQVSNNLSDVTAASARTNLGLGTAALISSTAGGDLSGTLPSPTVAKVNGVSVTGTPSSGYLLTATGSSAATWQAVTPLTLTGSSDVVQLAVKGNATQTSDIAQFQTSTGTVLGGVTSGSGSGLTIKAPQTGAGLYLQGTGSATTKVAELRIVENNGLWVDSVEAAYFQLDARVSGTSQKKAIITSGTFGADGPLTRLGINSGTTQFSDGTNVATLQTPSGALCDFITQGTDKVLAVFRRGTSPTSDMMRFQINDGSVTLASFDKSARFIAGGNVPTIAANAGAGTSPTIAVTGRDQAGTVTLTTGTGPSASATVCTVTFTASLTNAPCVVFCPANANAGTAPDVYVGSSTTTFTLSTTTALTGATQYIWNYHMIGV